ncbi:MAG: NUDIX hydrolase [Bacteroidota bacterium]|nr:NUDIX hydrolase [Bacteroidota bacterium]MDP4234395.1 NUDIX hydrolase [Bacteroidota bacterium]MDP4243328.1 NUDIX hydrolase [Bacteroidota bacterium]MDP4288013.1 NUDIX hydrolase [Bacteroidota bacterium]
MMRTRNQARGFVLNEAGHVLLVKYEDTEPVNPAEPEILHYWVLPGGGIEPGETYEQAVAREVLEETGVTVTEVGRRLYVLEKELIFAGSPHLMHAEYFFARCLGQPEAFNADPDEGIVDVRWWSYEQIRAADEIFLPKGFLKLFDEAWSDNSPERDGLPE